MSDRTQIKTGYNFLDVTISHFVYFRGYFFKLMNYTRIRGMCNNIMKNDLPLCAVKS